MSVSHHRGKLWAFLTPIFEADSLLPFIGCFIALLVSIFIYWKWKTNSNNNYHNHKSFDTNNNYNNFDTMGNGNSNNDSSSSEESDSDDIIPHKFNNPTKGIIDNDHNKSSSNVNGGGITSGVKSMFGGIKNYFSGPKQSEIEQLNQYENRYTNRAVFVKLSAPNYYFANQVQ